MNKTENLIFKKNENITDDVKFCKYNPVTNKYEIAFHSGMTYNCSSHSIEWVRDPEILNPTLVNIVHKGLELFKIQFIYIFHARATDYWHICFSNGSEKTYDRRDLEITYSCLCDSDAQNCMGYLRQLASINELKNDCGEVLLLKQYEKLKFVSADTAMAVYLNPEKQKAHTYQWNDLIFPFGGNASQFEAVNKALTNQISVIQGPPGTGKTQTILNIIANLLVMGKTVQVVSSSNSATENVLEKLSSPIYNLDFLVAPLGNSDNKEAFDKKQTGFYPAIGDWELDANQQVEVKVKIKSHIRELSAAFSMQERLAHARLELDSLTLEIKYFEQYCREIRLLCSAIKPRRSLSTEKIMQLWQECCEFSEKERAVSFWFKIKSTFIYGISDWSFYGNSLSAIITLFQNLFYQERKLELSNEIYTLENHLTANDIKGKMDELADWSMRFLRAKLFKRYGNKSKRTRFSEKDLQDRADEVIIEYPIILSTTFSSCSNLKRVTYDYLIMDEASQVDVATGALALSCARNAVIVGDLKQLPNVVKDNIKKRYNAIFNSFNLPQGYSFTGNSFLKSICMILHEAPQTLLREHYRCHPKIIGFCNQKFYNNELVIMTEDHNEPDTLAVIKTVVGDHRRNHTNQRQIDVTLQEVLPMLNDVNPEDVGIIAPYKDHVAAITQQLDTDKIEVKTTHKFQGREKDTIVLTMVDDVVTDFSDDPYLLNVAVSRAKRRLYLVVSGNEQPADSNIGDLISYIDYNNFKTVQSEIYSVFDLLYRQYTDARIAFLKKHCRVSAYDSENLMYGAIVGMLDSRPNLSLNVICHQPLNMLIRDLTHLNDEECRYVMNAATHIDFLIYNQISKKPILAIEVDGFHYHKPETQQYRRDRMKDHILNLYGIPLLRFPTNGSEERERVEQFLTGYENNR